MREEIKELVEEEMEKKGLEYISEKKELINQLYKEFCRDCQLKNECNICKALKEEVKEKIKTKVGEKNIK